MGACGSSANLTPEEVEEKKASRVMEDAINREQAADAQIKKLLLLGAGESGKSTLFKQAIKLYGKGYSEEEKRQYIPIIVNNVLSSIKTLIKYSDELAKPVTDANLKFKQMVDDAKADAATLSPELAQAITALWADSGIQATYDNRASFQLNDSTEYFTLRVDKICQPSYLPDDQDILRSRVRTTGIVETSFLIEGNNFKMFDVGGQRNERKKWIHCFENVTAVLFVAAISEYDQQLYEDETTNRMVEALTLFDEICNSRWFRETSMILFLNKKDLFMEKIKKKPIKECSVFHKYDGPNDYEHCSEYIKNEFVRKNKTPREKEVYTHITCATDTENIRVVFNAVKDIIIRKSLRDGGLL